MDKDIFYFSHDSNARNDDKMIEIRMKHDWYGYGVYFAIIEILREQKNYTYPSNAIAKLAYTLSIPLDKFEPIYNDLFDVKLFIKKGDIFYSESLMKRMEKIDSERAKRVNAGRKGGIAKAKLKQSYSNTLARKESKESKRKRIKESKESKKRYGEFKNVLLLDEQLEKLKKKFGNETAVKKIKEMDEAIKMKGYKYKDHYLAIIKWDERENKNIDFYNQRVSDESLRQQMEIDLS